MYAHFLICISYRIYEFDYCSLFISFMYIFHSIMGWYPFWRNSFQLRTVFKNFTDKMSSARTSVYISGRRSDAGTQILLPLPSAAVLFLVHYCDCDIFELVFVDEEHCASECVSVSFAVLLATKHTFIDKASCRHHCDLPVVCDGSVIRSGLCSTLRCLIKKCHAHNPGKNLHDLLVRDLAGCNICLIAMVYDHL
jgi:hypothetical protein